MLGYDRKRTKMAYASISLYGDTDPAFWTEYFGVEPDIFIIRGELFERPSGRMSTYPGRIGVWSCSSELAVEDDTLDPHARYLIARLHMPRADLPELLTKREATLRLVCFWQNSRKRAPLIDQELQDIITRSGGTIDIDRYPKRGPFITTRSAK